MSKKVKINYNTTFATTHSRDYYRGQSFHFSGKWMEGVHYISDDYNIDFVVHGQCLLACAKSHLSSPLNEPINYIYDERGTVTGVVSQYWDFILGSIMGKAPGLKIVDNFWYICNDINLPEDKQVWENTGVKAKMQLSDLSEEEVQLLQQPGIEVVGDFIDHSITQNTGNSEVLLMSQKAITNNLNLKANSADVTEAMQAAKQVADDTYQPKGNYVNVDDLTDLILANTTYFNNVEYNNNTQYIVFKHGENTIASIDASAFIKDGMIQNVKIEIPSSGINSGKSCLIIDFNTDSGITDIEIPLENIFNPNDYYTKIATDNKFVEKISGKSLSTNDYTDAEKSKLEGIASGAEVNVQSDWNQTTTTADDYIKNKPESLKNPNAVTIQKNSTTIDTYDGSEAKTINISVPTKTSDIINDSNFPVDANYTHTDNNYTTAEKQQLADVAGRVSTIEGKIPNAATSSNQLADKNFVNSSIATATASFRGTSESGLTEIQFLTWANSLTHDLNDYVYWVTIDADGNTLFKRYKYDGSNWIYEYTLNNSSFTSDEWAAIQSGITSNLVSKLNGIATGAEVNVQSDWNQTTDSADDYIKNKPTSMKNPTSLTFGSKTYDGSEAKTITASDLGALTQHQDISGKENSNNKITTLSASSTNTQYPSAKCVYDYVGTSIENKMVTLTMAQYTALQSKDPNVYYFIYEEN